MYYTSHNVYSYDQGLIVGLSFLSARAGCLRDCREATDAFMKCYFLCKQINRFSCFLSSSFVILGSESPKIRDFIDSRVKLTNPPKKKECTNLGFRTLVCRGVWEMGRSNATVTPSRKAVPYEPRMPRAGGGGGHSPDIMEGMCHRKVKQKEIGGGGAPELARAWKWRSPELSLDRLELTCWNERSLWN